MRKRSHILAWQACDGSLRTLKLVEAAYTIGRSKKADIFVDHPACSRHHATLLRVETERNTYYQIADGNPRNGRRSANGLFINGARVTDRVLDRQDRIFLGSQQARMSYLCVPRDRLLRADLQTITLGNASRSIIAIAPDGEAIVWRARATN